jgi:hypothetical protein
MSDRPLIVFLGEVPEEVRRYLANIDDRSGLPDGEHLPEVGDLVRLSAKGLSTAPLRTPEQVEAHTKGSRVIGVSRADVTPPTWDIDLEGPLGAFLLTHLDVEPITPTPALETP